MHLTTPVRHVLIAALSAGSLAALPAVASAATPPDNGVRHIVAHDLTYDNGQLARTLDTETWFDADSAFWTTTVDGQTTQSSADATGQYLYEPASNHVIHFKNVDVTRDEADPATYDAQGLPASGTDTIRGIAVEKRAQPAGTDPTQLHGVFYVNPSTGRIVRLQWVTTTGDVVDQTDIVTDEVLPDTPADHAKADVRTYPGASVEEFTDPAPSAASAKKQARRPSVKKAKKHKASKHTAAKRKAAKRGKAKHRTAGGR